MQNNTVATLAATAAAATATVTAKNTKSSKSSKTDDFDEQLEEKLKELEKSGNVDLAQLLAAYGLLVPTTQQQTAQNGNAQNGQTSQNGQSAQNGAVGGTSGISSNPAANLLSLLQLSSQGLVISKGTSKQSDAASTDTALTAKSGNNATAAAQAQNKAPTDLTAGKLIQTAQQTAQSAVQTAQAAQSAVQTAQAVQPEIQAAQTVGPAVQNTQAVPPTAQTTQTVQQAAGTAQPSQAAKDPAEVETVSAQNIVSVSNSKTVQQSQAAVSDSFSAQLDAASDAAAQNSSSTAQSVLAQSSAAQASGTAIDVKTVKSDDMTQQPISVSGTSPAQAAGSKQTAQSSQADGKGSKSDDNSKDKSDNSAAQSIFASVQAHNVEVKNTVAPEPKTEITNQVADALKQAVETGRTEVKLHLSPEDLGGISIKVVSQGGVLSVQITADNQSTGQLLASNMHELSQKMQDSGITMNKAEVTYAGTGGFDAATSQQQQNQQNSNYTLPKWTPAMDTSQKSSVSPVNGVSSDSDKTVSRKSGMSILA